MTESLDISRAPRGELVAARLVAAVAAGDDRLERHYLELKSDLDLAKKTDVAKVAKYILGSANRMPDVAAAAFEGHGVMIIGVAPGEARGVPPIEILEIDRIVRRYIGAAGPQWDLVRVPVKDSENEVLVVIVEPPKSGQGPFVCRRDGEGLADGAIYIRVEGATRVAKADEVELLIQRSAHAHVPDVSFDVAIDGQAVPIRVDEAQSVDAYIDEVSAQLVAALPRPEPTKASVPASDQNLAAALGYGREVQAMTAAQVMIADVLKAQSSAQSLLSTLYTTDPETRTEEQYRSSIEKWAARTRAQWPPAVDKLAGRMVDGFTIRVKNATKTFFHDVEVKIHLEGVVRGIDWLDHDYPVRRLDLPDPPRKWGPETRSKFDFGGAALGRVQMPVNYSGPTNVSPLDWRNSGSVDLRLDVGDLRPREEYAFDNTELVLVLRDGCAGVVEGTWEITARDHNEIYAGSLAVDVGQPVDLTDKLRHLLGLEDKSDDSADR